MNTNATTSFTVVEGGVCAAKGFVAGSARAGIKSSFEDIALIFRTTESGSFAATYTQNLAAAWCVRRNRELTDEIPENDIRAIVVNSGNANAATGAAGEVSNERMALFATDALKLMPGKVVTASTGIIGKPLPLNLLETGIRAAADNVQANTAAADAAAKAIMTTDLVAKSIAVTVDLGNGETITVGGMAKGSGMIAPNMATMLAFMTTDAAIEREPLQTALNDAVADSFNCLTVDGDTSTNDMCIVLSSGAAKNRTITTKSDAGYAEFADALLFVCTELAKMVARDGEGATKLVTIKIIGAKSDDDARAVARSIAESPLVKTALFGNDPNWGRILMALGHAAVSPDAFDADAIAVSIAGICLYDNGTPTDFDPKTVSRAMDAKDLEIAVDLRTGNDSSATFYTCDYSYDYIRINAEYHT